MTQTGKKEFVEKLANELATTKKEADIVFTAFEKVFKESLAETGDTVKLRGFLNGENVHVPSRVARNPKTGELVTTVPKNKVKVKSAIK